MCLPAQEACLHGERLPWARMQAMPAGRYPQAPGLPMGCAAYGFLPASALEAEAVAERSAGTRAEPLDRAMPLPDLHESEAPLAALRAALAVVRQEEEEEAAGRVH